MDLKQRFNHIRAASVVLTQPLSVEDMVVQPVEFVSPIKWHLGYTTWFFEVMILQKYYIGYTKFDSEFDFAFNSYYEGLGKRVLRTDRGNLTRPTLDDVLHYREYVDRYMQELLGEWFSKGPEAEQKKLSTYKLVELGLQHEQQHQELMLMDIKYIFGTNPFMPTYSKDEYELVNKKAVDPSGYIRVFDGLYSIGHSDSKFAFDNEMPRHKVYTPEFHICETLLTCGDIMHFMEVDGYRNPKYWTSEGLEWAKNNSIFCPMYWFYDIDSFRKEETGWRRYDLDGVHILKAEEIATHLSWYEADAIARFFGKRLPTEEEWEVAAAILPNKGIVWEHTGSAYRPYPGFKEFAGEAREYNGKFMINQMVCRGSSLYTPKGHSRDTYRNFFHPHERWFMGGVRLAY